tara:strand:- start:55 stop:300 length:246 start_codon:yes stop_codon:yes gene_type:complete
MNLKNLAKYHVEAPGWLGDDIEGNRVIAWRLTKKLVESTPVRIIGRHWRYEIITEGFIYNALEDGTLISKGCLNMCESEEQ